MPRLSNVLVNPQVRLLADQPVADAPTPQREARLRVTGLLCSL